MAKIIRLKRLTGYGAEPSQANILQMVGARNKYLEMDEGERECLNDIVTEVAKINDFIMCHSDMVEALVEGPIEDHEEDSVVIVFHSFLFHECTWTLTAMTDYEDLFEIGDGHMFFLVKDLNSPAL